MNISHHPIPPELFITNRQRLAALLPANSLAVLNANDVPPTNADGSAVAIPNSDLFHLSGVEQEQSILLLYPGADDEKLREMLFLREATPESERWEGHKLSAPEAQDLSGIRHIHELADFPRLFHRLMCECEHVFLNSNEHKRAVIEVESRDARFVAETMRRYPLHDYRRLAPLLHQLRAVKSDIEAGLIRQACDVTAEAFARVYGRWRRNSRTSSSANDAASPIRPSSPAAPMPASCITWPTRPGAKKAIFFCWTWPPAAPITTPT
jgi:Xaa-Pro aminopeptidase